MGAFTQLSPYPELLIAQPRPRWLSFDYLTVLHRQLSQKHLLLLAMEVPEAAPAVIEPLLLARAGMDGREEDDSGIHIVTGAQKDHVNHEIVSELRTPAISSEDIAVLDLTRGPVAPEVVRTLGEVVLAHPENPPLLIIDTDLPADETVRELLSHTSVAYSVEALGNGLRLDHLAVDLHLQRKQPLPINTEYTVSQTEYVQLPF